MRNILVFICLIAVSFFSIPSASAQETIKVYGFACTYDLYDEIWYVSDIVEATAGDKSFYSPDSQNLKNQWTRKLREIIGKDPGLLNNSVYGFKYKDFTPLNLGSGPKKPRELSAISTLEAMKKLRAEKIAEYKKNGRKIVEIKAPKFIYTQQKK